MEAHMKGFYQRRADGQMAGIDRRTRNKALPGAEEDYEHE